MHNTQKWYLRAGDSPAPGVLCPGCDRECESGVTVPCPELRQLSLYSGSRLRAPTHQMLRNSGNRAGKLLIGYKIQDCKKPSILFLCNKSDHQYSKKEKQKRFQANIIFFDSIIMFTRVCMKNDFMYHCITTSKDYAKIRCSKIF